MGGPDEVPVLSVQLTKTFSKLRQNTLLQRDEILESYGSCDGGRTDVLCRLQFQGLGFRT